MAQANFFPMDPAMDLCILAAVQLSLGRIHIPRLIAAQLLLSAFTTACLFLRIDALPIWILIAPLFPSAAIACGAKTPRRTIEAAACMFCIGAAAAAFSLLSGRKPFICASTGVILLLFLFRRRRNMKCIWNIGVSVEKDGLCANFEALIDTGNRLREHSSAQPVLIVEAGASGDLASYAEALPESEKRELPFGVLGGAGKISCFKPDHILLHPPGSKAIPAPKCWIGIYPGRIPGATRALAPPEFAEALQENRIIPEQIQNGARRFCYGVFKR